MYYLAIIRDIILSFYYDHLFTSHYTRVYLIRDKLQVKRLLRRVKNYSLVRDLGRCENKVGGRNETHVMEVKNRKGSVYTSKSLLVTRKTAVSSAPRCEQRSFVFAERHLSTRDPTKEPRAGTGIFSAVLFIRKYFALILNILYS